MPDVELERPGLREPQERRQVVAQQIGVLLVLVRRKKRDRLDEVGPLLLQCSGKKRCQWIPSGMRIMVTGAILEVRAG